MSLLAKLHLKFNMESANVHLGPFETLLPIIRYNLLIFKTPFNLCTIHLLFGCAHTYS